MNKTIKQSSKIIFWLLGLVWLIPLTGQAATIEFNSEGIIGGVITSANSEPNGLPWDKTPLSPVYEYALENPFRYDPAYPMEVRIYYDKANQDHKQIFIADALFGQWVPLPTQDIPQESYAKVTLTVPMGRVVLLSDPQIMTVGDASWYRFKGGDFAASPDYPKGSVLKVTNLDNNKTVEVTINDYGPDRSIFPNRVIDLDRVAFEKIASPAAGLARVKVEPVTTIKSEEVAKQEHFSEKPQVSASSALVYWEEGDKVLLAKNEDVVRPLASLTKLVAVKVFLEQQPNWQEVVSYQVADENYNYQACTDCAPGEIAKLALRAGETVRIEDLLYSTLVSSANNTVESLVRVSGLSRPEFIARMNDLVKSWGAKQTSFVEPSGLDVRNVSSAQDYAIIAREVFKDEAIERLSTTKNFSLTTINTQKKLTVSNTNQLLRNSEFKIVGSKTGYLDEAGNCLVTKVKTAQGTLIAINLNSAGKDNSWADNEQLIKYGLSQLKK